MKISPKILEYQDGRILITLNAALIPEIKLIIDKYGEASAEPFLSYVHLMTSLDSPYINLPDEEKEETVIYDLHQMFSNFDPTEPLLKPALEKLTSLYETRVMRFFKSIGKAIDRTGEYLETAEITEGKDGNLTEIIRLLKESGSTIANYKNLEKQVEEELQVQLRGNNEIGEY